MIMPLWAALCLPRLPLESFLRASPTADPWAAAEGRHVLDCNEAAFAQGVRPGMARSAAAALVPALRFRERDGAAERATLEGVAAWAGQFTPNVALAAGEGLLLEISGSLSLFGGAAAILAGLQRGTRAMGLTGRTGCAPSAQGAWLLARGGSCAPCLTQAELARRLHPLPVDVLGCGTHALANLEAVGVRTIGELLALPRAGLARRFGPGLLDELDRALGVTSDARRFFTPPERFYAVLELPAEVNEAPALVFAAQRLIAQLGGFLAGKNGGVQRFRLELFHKDARTDIGIGLVQPSRDTEHFVLLVRERLSVLRLKAPVRALALAAADILALAPVNLELLDDAVKRPGDWNGLIERLRARLGSTAVNGIAAHADHRPEAAWRIAELGEKRAPLEFGTRPLWLFDAPRPLDEIGATPHYGGPLALLAGPERIESGWWDGDEVARDYFVARARTESLLWIYRERRLSDARWYLHGIFG